MMCAICCFQSSLFVGDYWAPRPCDVTMYSFNGEIIHQFNQHARSVWGLALSAPLTTPALPIPGTTLLANCGVNLLALMRLWCVWFQGPHRRKGISAALRYNNEHRRLQTQPKRACLHVRHSCLSTPSLTWTSHDFWIFVASSAANLFKRESVKSQLGSTQVLR
jgi:hypothetical protein